MAITFGKNRYKQHRIFYTILTAILLIVVFLGMVGRLYINAKNEAYENLHVQTKQIKDDITLQLISDRENLATMANFAAKLYSDGESYDLLFDSFKPIGLIENIGILKPDNTFVTKAGCINLDGLIYFGDEEQKGSYISGRVKDLTRDNYEIIRTAVPIIVENETVGIIYGVIKLDKIGERYSKMAEELNAQLFVYDKVTGDLVIDNIHKELGNISFLKDRKYNDGYTYEKIASSDKGYSSFLSAYKDENAHMHYSTIDDIGWMIAVVRYDSQVFEQTNELVTSLLLVFFVMIVIIIGYIFIILTSEKNLNSITSCASDIRKILLETSGNSNNILDALKEICIFARARSVAFFDTDGEDYNYISPEIKQNKLSEKDKTYFRTELFKYATEYYNVSGNAVSILCIKPNKHLYKTNKNFYNFLIKNNISDVSLSATINNANHTTILVAINSKRSSQVRMLAEKVSACFSMALYNKNYLNKTKLTATTDSLTGALNRVAYKNDLEQFNEEKASNFSCIYVDVNELHLINNKYGHSAGDEMLIYIANTLKEVFYGHSVYRMGGDEFLVFCKNSEQEVVKKAINNFIEQLKYKNYHVAIGLSYRTLNSNTEEMVKEAEIKMYEAKAQFYQNKEQQSAVISGSNEYVQIKTGILEIDTMLSVLKEKYNGIYRVSLDDDKAHRILMPAYLNYNEDEEHFSQLFKKYISDVVESDYHRALINFLNYDVIKTQISQGKTPKITYKKHNGETVSLCVYKLCDDENLVRETLWVFSKV